MLAMPKISRLSLLTLLSGFVLTVFVIHYRSSAITGKSWAYNARGLEYSNGTLGFGGIFVVSAIGSDRIDHLHQRAAVTGLDLTVPEQKQWTDEEVSDFRWPNVSESKVSVGSVKAWLSHHLVLRAFLDTNLDSALIIEDDVDWDIRLRTLQIPLAQKAAQSLLEVKSSEIKQHPWGTPDVWDIFYLGHCGDWLNKIDQGVGIGHHHPFHLNNLTHVMYDDPSLLNRTDLHPFTASFMTALNLPDHQRVLHRSSRPLCSFGYAVTRSAAEKLLTDYAAPKEDIAYPKMAYDFAIMSGCRHDPNFKCYTLLPELLHHMKGDSLIMTIDSHPFLPPVDEKGLEQVMYRQETSNIGCGFYSGDFYYEGDTEKLEMLKEEVGRKGRCLKPGRE